MVRNIGLFMFLQRGFTKPELVQNTRRNTGTSRFLQALPPIFCTFQNGTPPPLSKCRRHKLVLMLKLQISIFGNQFSTLLFFERQKAWLSVHDAHLSFGNFDHIDNIIL